MNTWWQYSLAFFLAFILCGCIPVVRREASIRDLFYFGIVGAIAGIFIWALTH